tara:strand:+ start:393 stop:518 length:126 start_codon:yes stop_codon:yes gene_type:complete
VLLRTLIGLKELLPVKKSEALGILQVAEPVLWKQVLLQEEV